ncbi:MAG: hypothetical protein M1814_005170 [Vezdaea aestivalis]|nr:MAG: hypothetical protein M1814_005170 [Vezdaea aestivalis]
MSDTCIVCLGDLQTGLSSESPSPSEVLPGQQILIQSSLENGFDLATSEGGTETARPKSRPSPPPDTGAAPNGQSGSKRRTNPEASEDERIAHLHPCGHDLHNDCLKPWVERANSCPICRQNFNYVTLMQYVGGPEISGYTVEDKVQVADIDPSLYIEDDIEEQSEADSAEVCASCGEHVEENELLICAGCNILSHIHCANLDRQTSREWYCSSCQTHRPLESASSAHSQRRSTQGPPLRRSRRAATRRSRPTDRAWTSVWEAVSTRLDFDLEFPFEEDGSLVGVRRRSRLQPSSRQANDWRRRLLIAQENGAANEFIAEAPIPERNHGPRAKVESVEPESQEEIRAWNAFEKAQQMAENSSSERNKRKRVSSTSSSPTEKEAEAEPERKLKRPRTRRLADHAEAPPATAMRMQIEPRIMGEGSADSTSPITAASSGPTFLQSLLSEVESGINATDNVATRGLAISTDHSTPWTFTSPGSSPTASNHPTPKARSSTPPPYSSPRTGSPVPLTSKIEPIFSSPEFSPSRSPRQDTVSRPCQKSDTPDIHCPRPSRPKTRNDSPRRATDSSPSRANMSLEVKSDISKMVGAALKPFYRDESISKEQYTTINRNVSRLLYDKIGSISTLNEVDRERWEKVASEETSKAVEVLKWSASSS